MKQLKGIVRWKGMNSFVQALEFVSSFLCFNQLLFQAIWEAS